MAEFTLSNLRSESEKRYGSTHITDADGGAITFYAPLRLTDDDLKQTQDLVEHIDELGRAENANDMETARAIEGPMREVLKLVCSDRARFDAFFDSLDRADRYTLFEMWSQAAQPGEASA